MTIYLGISGTRFSGKETIQKIISNNFRSISFDLTDILLEEMKKQGRKRLSNSDLNEFADNLRLSKGPGILSEIVIKKIAEIGDKILEYEVVIIKPITNPWETEALRQTFKRYFFQIFIDSEIEIRYSRAISEAKKIKRPVKEIISFEEFMRINQEEFIGREDRKILDKEDSHGGVIDYGINLSGCLKKSNKVILNNNTKKELENIIVSLIKDRIEEVKKPIE